MAAPLPENETERLLVLKRYQLLDTKPEAAFDGITRIAAVVCNTPIALVSIIDENRQWFKSRVGVEVTETSRDYAFCAYAILEHEPLIVEDATLDSRFALNPLVTGEPRIRFYAGAPLIAPDGHGMGTLCVIDRTPRKLPPEQIEILQLLARQVVELMEQRKIASELAEALQNVKVLNGLLPICGWCKSIRDDSGYWSRVEDYLQKHSDTKMTHGICPKCQEKFFKE